MKPRKQYVEKIIDRLRGKPEPVFYVNVARFLIDEETIKQFPHCDQRILHAPGECLFCDKYKEWQALRVAWGIAFTGWVPEGKELPCPADHARGGDHKHWSGNIAQPKEQS